MKANDLRIGNYIEKSLKSGQGRKLIDKIGCQDIVRIFENTGSFNYEPIPITMEWIEKFGFVFEELGEEPTIEEQSYRKAIRGYGSKSFEIEFNRYEDAFILDFITGELINYKYVHELQNLYYLLIGSELSVS